MKDTQISIGRFHHFHLARQLQKHGYLYGTFTVHPRFQLKDEPGIPSSKIHAFPWLHAPYMPRGRIGLDRSRSLDRQWAWCAHETLDCCV
jgi:hypothetical protein